MAVDIVATWPGFDLQELQIYSWGVTYQVHNGLIGDLVQLSLVVQDGSQELVGVLPVHPTGKLSLAQDLRVDEVSTYVNNNFTWAEKR